MSIKHSSISSATHPSPWPQMRELHSGLLEQPVFDTRTVDTTRTLIEQWNSGPAVYSAKEHPLAALLSSQPPGALYGAAGRHSALLCLDSMALAASEQMALGIFEHHSTNPLMGVDYHKKTVNLDTIPGRLDKSLAFMVDTHQQLMDFDPILAARWTTQVLTWSAQNPNLHKGALSHTVRATDGRRLFARHTDTTSRLLRCALVAHIIDKAHDSTFTSGMTYYDYIRCDLPSEAHFYRRLIGDALGGQLHTPMSIPGDPLMDATENLALRTQRFFGSHIHQGRHLAGASGAFQSALMLLEPLVSEPLGTAATNTDQMLSLRAPVAFSGNVVVFSRQWLDNCLDGKLHISTLGLPKTATQTQTAGSSVDLSGIFEELAAPMVPGFLMTLRVVENLGYHMSTRALLSHMGLRMEKENPMLALFEQVRMAPELGGATRLDHTRALAPIFTRLGLSDRSDPAADAVVWLAARERINEALRDYPQIWPGPTAPQINLASRRTASLSEPSSKPSDHLKPAH